MKLRVLTLSEKSDILASLDKVVSIGVQLSQEELQSWNQEIDSEDIDRKVEDDDREQCIVTTAEISTTEAIETFNKVIA